MKVKDFLKEYINKSIQYHVFDSQQELSNSQGSGHKEQNYKVYCYNITMNNKPREGDVFLYRRPGKVTKDRKFVIYGGGVIDTITAPDKDGNVKANIIKGFKLKDPLIQGSKEIEDFQWTFKNKKPGSWAHFWSLYGMNVINYDDFIKLVGNRECEEPDNIDISDVSIENYINSYKNSINVYYDINNKVCIHVDNDSYNKDSRMHRLLTYINALYYMNVDKNSLASKSFDDICKSIVEKLMQTIFINKISEGSISVQRIEDTSIPADIVIKHADGVDYINVKATESSIRDGFYLSPQEVEFSKKCGNSYKIYRLYDVNLKEGKIKIKIYEGPFNNDNYRMAVTAWKIYEK